MLSDGTCIRFSKSSKNLGVHLDPLLTFRSQISHVSSHCYQLLKSIGRIRNILSQNQIEILVHAVISSKIDYCNSVYYGINKNIISALQKVQNAAVRMIFKLKRRTSVSEYYKKLHWLKIEQRIYYKIILMVFKCANGIAPVQLTEKIIKFKNIDTLTLNCMQCNSKSGRRSFSYIGPRLWNEVPIEIRKLSDLESFKSGLKTLLYNNFEEFKSRVFRYI